MFDKVKNLNKLRKAQSEIKKQMEQIFVSGEKGRYKVRIRGDKRIESLEVDGEEEKMLKDLLNDTLREAEKKSEKKLRGQMGDLGLGDFF